jgi:hypothetical protein
MENTSAESNRSLSDTSATHYGRHIMFSIAACLSGFRTMCEESLLTTFWDLPTCLVTIIHMTSEDGIHRESRNVVNAKTQKPRRSVHFTLKA